MARRIRHLTLIIMVCAGLSSSLLAASPSITSLSPTSGTVGTSVTITGKNFGSTQGSSTLKFNGTTATPTSWSSTTIVAQVPAAATTGSVVVTVGGTASNGVSFTVVPNISSLSPTSAAVGASVTISGGGFGSTQGTSTVKFNGTAATPTSWGVSSIVAPVPTGATTGNVVVAVGGVNSNGVSFTVVPAPSISSLSPTSGAVGASVTIAGTNFGSTQGTSTVSFNGAAATPTTWSATSIVAPVPSGATTGNVVVHASGVNSNGVSFTVLAAPNISSLSPTSGAVSASVTITGTNFGATQGTSTVKFNGTVATPSSWSATSIVAPVPSGATTGNVVVNASGVNSNGVSFTVVPAPSISSLSPTSGAVGASVTITGTNFGATQGTSTVSFNGTAATPTSWSATSIVAPVPSGATTGNVVVHASGVNSNGVNFTVVPPPSITSLSQGFGAVGASVTIGGTNFGATQGSSAVTFNGTAATTITSWSGTSIVAVVPSGATTGNLVVTVSGVPSNGVAFTVTPSITGLSPTSAGVGMSVTITGSNFGASQGTSTVLFSNAQLTAAPTSWSTTSIVTPVPANATTGLVNVQVGGYGSNGVNFTVLPTPTITGLSPNSGPIGTWVTITGTNFGTTQGTSTVTFNGTAATTITSWSATQIVLAVPPGTTTGNVVITVSGVPSAGTLFTKTTAPPIPSVVQVQPANGASNIALNTRVVVRFAQPVQPVSVVNGVVTLSQASTPVAGSVAQSNDGLSLTFIPSQNLTASASYTVSVQDIAAGQTTPQFQSTFTTGTTTDATAPRVVQLSPPSSATGVPINAPLVVQFTKPMDPSTLTPQAFAVTDAGVNVAGTVQVDPTGLTASFVPSQFLGVGHYVSSSNLGATIRDTSGNGLSGGGSFAFTTSFSPDSQGPTLVGTSPANVATGIPLNSLVVLEFDKPLDVISVSAGFQVLSGGQPVAGGIALSDGNKRITFTPSASLTANTIYTVTTTTQITDVGGFPITNPGSSTFTTSNATDTTTPSVTAVGPTNAATGVPTNVIAQVQFSKPIDPLTVTTTTLQLSPPAPGIPVPGTTTVSASGQMATFFPSAALLDATRYTLTATNGITDLEGHALSSSTTYFTTGLVTSTSAPTVVMVNPQNGATGAPVNVRVDLVMSAALSAASVGSSAVTVSAGGTPAAGTITLSSDRTTLTFTPSSLLAVSTVYTVAVSGVTDQAGNAIAPFTSTFTTSASGTANTTHPSVVTVSPANGASAVSVNTTIVLTFNEAIDGSTVNNSTVPISISAFSGVLAGSYSLDATGTVLTFTPVSPLPGSTTIRVQLSSSPTVLDLSGNPGNSFFSSFTTAATADTTPPAVVTVTPANGATNIGLNAQVVLTFSESLNPTTIIASNFALFANGSNVAAAVSNSADNRVVTLTPSVLPGASTVEIVATSGVKDLSGNALGNFASQFTTAAPFDAAYPSVVSQRPGNGAFGVPLSANAVLYISEAMNASTVQGAVHVSQNGVLVSGTTQVTDNGQVVQFTPSVQWQPGALIQVFMDSTAMDLDGVAATSYQGSFTTVANISGNAPKLLSSNPPYSATGVPTNVVIDMAYDQPLNPATLSGSSVACYHGGAWFQSAFSLLNGGTLLQVVPRFVLPANTSGYCLLSTGILGVNGIPILNGGNYGVYFTTGTGPDNVVPTIVSVSPPNGSSNVGDNAIVRLVFSKPVNPLTVNASTIQLSGGGTTAVPDSIAFSNNNQSVLLTPHAPLPDSTQMTLAISGITDVAGNAVAPQTTQFTTGNGPDLARPVAVSTSPFSNATNVPLNAVVILQVNEPIDPGTVNSSSLLIKDATTGLSVTGTYSVSSDGQTITFLPAAALTASRIYSVTFTGQGITDLAGNLLTSSANAFDFSFTTGTAASTSAPQVNGISPVNGATAIPTNVQVMIQFNEPVDAAKLNGVTLTGGGTVNVSQVLSSGNQILTLIPALPLSPSTAYTVTVAGVQDLSGNALATPVTTSFTTAAGANLIAPSVASVSPANGASGIATNITIQVHFAYPINPLTVTNATFQIYPNTTTIPISGSIAVSADGLTATFTPSQPLDPSTVFVVKLTGGDLDLEGRGLNWSSVFTTTSGSVAIAPTIASLSQSSATVGTTVWLNGTYFGTSQGLSTISFNGVNATATSWSDTQVFVTVPSGATSGPVTITVNGAASNAVTFKVLATPSITSVSPTSGSAGNSITVTGTNFGDAVDSTIVSFSGFTATPTSWNATSITVPVPATAPGGNLSLTVSVNGYTSNAVSFTVIPTPSVLSLLPTSGVPGTPVTILGSNFGATQGTSTITFNGVPPASITSWSSTSIAAVTPSNVTTGPVTVTVNSVPSNSNQVFTVTTPAIGNLTPPAAAVGAQVNVNGSGFYTQGQNTQVFFNGVPATIILYGGVPSSPWLGNTQLTVVVPPAATSGPVTVQVGSVTSNSAAFTLEPAPTATGIIPAAGQIGSTVFISGTGFGATQSSSSVSFYPGVTAQIVSWSDTAIQAIVPGATSTGVFNVQVGTLTAQGPSFQITNVTQLTDSLNNQSSYATAITAGSWTLSSSSGPGCSTCSVRGNTVETVDASGNVLTHTDDLGHVTTYTYDSNNNVASVSQQLDANTPVTTSYTYNSFSEVLAMTDALGNVTTNVYDTKGNLTSVTSPQPNGSTPASVTHFVYDTKGELTQITDPLTNPTNITYTPAGLIATITDAQQHTTTYQYDTRGNRTAVIDPINGASHPTTFSYDLMNRLTGITYPDGSSVGFGYDSRGRRTSVTDQNQKTTTYAYDDADRMTSITDPANNVTQYAYDTEGNLTSITDANNHTTYFGYNARGWVTQTTFPSTLYETYAYDAVGNLQTKTDRKNQTIQYVYDALNRLTSKNYPDSTSANYVYDLVGKIKQVTDPTGLYGFAYDNMGRLVGTTTQYTFVTGTYSNSYGYDAASNRTSLTGPDGSITTYGYDTLNRLSGLANSWAGTFGFGYDALSRRTSLTRPNGVNTSYSYDSLSRLLSVLHQTGSTTVDGASYTYDNAGNRTSKTNYLNNITEGYTYDPIYQLTQVVQGATTTESYSYDLVGNRLSSLGVPSYNYNASNELTSNSLGSYTYDNNGSTLIDANGKAYAWDFENRLTQAVIPGTGTVNYKYDPFGRRVQKSGPSGTTNYLYDGKNSMEEVDNAGNVLARYNQTQGLDEELSEYRSGTTSYYEADGLSTITSLSNPSGALANTYTYDSYGKLTGSTGTLTNPFRYTGRESDSETGLYFNRMRYFDPASGRWLSEDPIRFVGSGPNFYAYVGNDPTNLVDPLGLTNCVVTSTMGVVCSDWNTNWSWMEPQAPQPPPGPPGLAPNPPRKPGRLCGCSTENPRYWRRVFQINEEAEQKQWELVKKEIGAEAAAEAVEKWGPHWAEHVVPWWKGYSYIKLEYELLKIGREAQKEIENEKQCGSE